MPDRSFAEQEIHFGRTTGQPLEVRTASPMNHAVAMSGTSESREVVVHAQLFVRDGATDMPVVIIVPGNFGLEPHHIDHARTLFNPDIAVLLIDPFGGRQLQSTITGQVSLTTAARTLDVVRCLDLLADHPQIDPLRIGAQGHDSGGAAVLGAAVSHFVNATSTTEARLCSVLAVSPFCNLQFLEPSIGTTRVRALVGDRDDWVSVQQIQQQIQAMMLLGGHATYRLERGCAHGFDRPDPIAEISQARATPTAPTEFILNDGTVVDPLTGLGDPDRSEQDAFSSAMKSGLGRIGVRMGSDGHQAQRFQQEMVAFHQSVFNS